MSLLRGLCACAWICGSTPTPPGPAQQHSSFQIPHAQHAMMHTCSSRFHACTTQHAHAHAHVACACACACACTCMHVHAHAHAHAHATCACACACCVVHAWNLELHVCIIACCACGIWKLECCCAGPGGVGVLPHIHAHAHRPRRRDIYVETRRARRGPPGKHAPHALVVRHGHWRARYHPPSGGGRRHRGLSGLPAAGFGRFLR